MTRSSLHGAARGTEIFELRSGAGLVLIGKLSAPKTKENRKSKFGKKGTSTAGMNFEMDTYTAVCLPCKDLSHHVAAGR